MIDSADVNEYLREITGEYFTAKDFRTWAGTVLASLALQEMGAFDKDMEARRKVVAAVERVAERLGNTPSVCRKCYIHPDVISAYLEGSLIETLTQRTEEELAESVEGLDAEETAVLAFLRRGLAREAEQDRARDGSGEGRTVDGGRELSSEVSCSVGSRWSFGLRRSTPSPAAPNTESPSRSRHRNSAGAVSRSARGRCRPAARSRS